MVGGVELFSKRKARRLARAGEIDALIDLLARGTRRQRRAAARVLGEVGDPRALEPLIATLHTTYGEDEDLTPVVVSAIGKFRDPRATEALTRLLADRQDDGFYFLAHREAILALADLDVFEPLKEVSRDDTRDRALRSEAKGQIRGRRPRT
jgi:HEAT repeat protein